MKRIRRTDTDLELIVRNLVWSLGFRYTLRNNDLPGSPDLANRTNCWAIFVHGCFWHHHGRCKAGSVPKSNRAFWIAKLSDNKARDRRKLVAIRGMGFRALEVWGCEIERFRLGDQRLAEKLADFIRPK